MRLKKIICLVTTLAIMLSLAMIALGASVSARSMVVFETSGEVKYTKGTAKEYNAKPGTKLHDGYTLSTSANSYAYVNLDDESLAKLDQKTKINVTKLSSSKLSFSVLSGSVSVSAGKQKDGETLAVVGGNAALTVRGTLFIIEYNEDGTFVIIMLSGSGEVYGRVVQAGYMMTVSDLDSFTENSIDPTDEKAYEVTPLVVGGKMSIFLLESIKEYQEQLIAEGLITEDDLPLIDKLLEEKYAERDAEGANIPQDIHNEIIYFDDNNESTVVIPVTSPPSQQPSSPPPSAPSPPPSTLKDQSYSLSSADLLNPALDSILSAGYGTVIVPPGSIIPDTGATAMSIHADTVMTMQTGSVLNIGSGGLTVNGSLILEGSATLNSGPSNMSLNGNMTLNPGATLNAGGNVTVTGGTLTNLSSSTIKLYGNMILNNEATLVNGGDGKDGVLVYDETLANPYCGNLIVNGNATVINGTADSAIKLVAIQVGASGNLILENYGMGYSVPNAAGMSGIVLSASLNVDGGLTFYNGSKEFFGFFKASDGLVANAAEIYIENAGSLQTMIDGIAPGSAVTIINRGNIDQIICGAGTIFDVNTTGGTIGNIMVTGKMTFTGDESPAEYPIRIGEGAVLWLNGAGYSETQFFKDPGATIVYDEDIGMAVGIKKYATPLLGEIMTACIGEWPTSAGTTDPNALFGSFAELCLSLNPDVTTALVTLRDGEQSMGPGTYLVNIARIATTNGGAKISLQTDSLGAADLCFVASCTMSNVSIDKAGSGSFTPTINISNGARMKLLYCFITETEIKGADGVSWLELEGCGIDIDNARLTILLKPDGTTLYNNSSVKLDDTLPYSFYWVPTASPDPLWFEIPYESALEPPSPPPLSPP